MRSVYDVDKLIAERKEHAAKGEVRRECVRCLEWFWQFDPPTASDVVLCPSCEWELWEHDCDGFRRSCATFALANVSQSVQADSH